MKKATEKHQAALAMKEHKRILKADRRRSPQENYQMAFEGYILNFYSHLAN